MISYDKNEIIWAKVKGYPWWPAKVIFYLTQIDC
jgi:hypothetical protein